MKQITISLFFIFSTIISFAQSKDNARIVGEWYNFEKDAIITLFEDNNLTILEKLLG